MKNTDIGMEQCEYLIRKDLQEKGVTKYRFYKFLKDNKFEQIRQGIYIVKDEWIDELYVLHKRCPKAVISHDEAFYYHGLSDREPLIHTITVYSGYNSHRLRTDGNCKVYYVKKELLNVGRIIVKDFSGNDVLMYNLERTICDLIRNRNSIEIQDFNRIIKSYILRKDKDLNLLMEYAKMFRIDNVVRKYMEILL